MVSGKTSVFGLSEMLAQMPSWLSLPSKPLEKVEFVSDDFKVPESEQTINLHRGSKRDFNSLLHFWVQSLKDQEWNGQTYFSNYVQRSKYLPLTEVGFGGIVREYSRSLIRPFALNPIGGFITALQMQDEWNEVSAVAEYEAEFIAFYWTTTA